MGDGLACTEGAAAVGQQQTDRSLVEALFIRVGDFRESGREGVHVLQRPHDLVLPVVERPDEAVDLAERVPDAGLAAGKGVRQLDRDGLELGDAAAVEQGGQRGQHLFGLRVAARASVTPRHAG